MALYGIPYKFTSKYSLWTRSGVVIVALMDIALLKTFLSVVNTRHFGKAGEALFVTQAAVSARIKLLENTLGTRLFTRDRNNIQLTPTGERLLRHAEIIVHAWERARLDVALNTKFSQSLAVGTTLDLWQISVKNWIEELYKTRPNLTLHLEISKTESLVNMVLNSMLDLAFVFEPPTTSELLTRQMEKITLVLVSNSPGLTAQDAIKENYIFVNWGRSFSMAHAAFVQDQCIPRVHCSSGRIAFDLLLSQGGSCYLAKQMVESCLASGELHLVPGAPTIERFSYAVFRPENECSELIQDILAAL